MYRILQGVIFVDYPIFAIFSLFLNIAIINSVFNALKKYEGTKYN